MKTSEIILRARDKITPQGAWTQEATARNSLGNMCYVLDNEACSFCMLGALMSVSKVTAKVGYISAACIKYIEDSIGQAYGSQTIARFNDYKRRTQLECLLVLGQAAILAINNDD